MPLQLGKLDAVKSPALSDLTVYVNGKMPNPPATVAAPSNVVWGMDDNDRLSCCVCSGAEHLIAAWSADLNIPEQRPTDAEIESTYFGLTGGQDTGLNEQSVLTTWQRNGLFNNRIKAFAPFDGHNIKTLQQVVAFYRGAFLGIQCPQSAQQNFANGVPWTYDPSSPIEGGHCIVGVGYTASALLCVSWGAVVEVTWPFLSHYLDESWAIIGQEIAEHHGDGVGLDYTSLLADLAKI